jgi:ribosomal protein L40E
VTALLVGTLLAVISLCYVLYPLYRADVSPVPRPVRASKRESPAVEALRDLEFDRQTGKISDDDYDSLKARYTTQALAAMRASGAAICENCGPRPEADAEYCSRCGAALVA